MSLEPKVEFLIGGVQKGGTTALFRYLEDLGAVSIAPAKEVHFFDDETGVDWAAPDYGRYHAMFPPADGRPRGEATPIYIYWPNCLERIARYNPAMKLIFLFRDPVERAWSQWKMEYARGWETEPFAWCIREGRARVDSAEAPGFHRVFSYVERGFYGAQLARMYEFFPPEQVLVLRSQDLDAEPQATLARICAFLGVEPPAGPVTPRRELTAKDIDYGQLINDEDMAYLRALYADDLQRFTQLSGLVLKPAAARPTPISRETTMSGQPLSSGFTAHNVRLDDGAETFPQAGVTIDQLGNYCCVRNMLRVVYPNGFVGKSIVDLGCLEGGFTTEFARLGLESTGIEVRESNLQNARYIQSRLNLPNLHFHQDDAWNVGKYGPFDVVFCVGLFYHMEDPRRFLGELSEACRKLIFLDTHFAPEDDDHPAIQIHRLSAMEEHEGMRGRWYTEHDLDPDQSREELETLKWASWRNKRSFWPTKGALIKAMRKAGFDVVLEDFDALGAGSVHALSKDGWAYQNHRWMLVGIKLT